MKNYFLKISFELRMKCVNMIARSVCFIACAACLSASVVLPWCEIDARNLLAVEQTIVVLVGDEERPLLDEVHVQIVAEQARHRGRLDLGELIERETRCLVLAVLVIESIAVLEITELFGHNARSDRAESAALDRILGDHASP